MSAKGRAGSVELPKGEAADAKVATPAERLQLAFDTRAATFTVLSHAAEVMRDYPHQPPDDQTLVFVAKTFAIAALRLPHVMHAIFAALLPPDDNDIVIREFRGTNFTLDEHLK